MLNYLFFWPEQLVNFEGSENPLIRAAVFIRLQEFQRAEALLLTLLVDPLYSSPTSPHSFDLYLLLFWLYRSQKLLIKSGQVLEKLKLIGLSPSEFKTLKLLKIVHWLDVDDAHSLNILSISDWYFSCLELPFSLFYVDFLLRARQFDLAQKTLNTLVYPWAQSAEALILQARIHQELHDWKSSLDILLACVERFSQNIYLYSFLLIATVEARSHKHAIPVLRRAIELHGEKSEFYSHLCRIALLQNRSADSRRYSIKDCLIKLTQNPLADRPLSNYWVTQDRLGNSDWLTHIYPKSDPFSYYPVEMLEPMISQLASINGSHSISRSLVNIVLDKFSQYASQSSHPLTPSQFPGHTSFTQSSKQLTIAWISSDVNFHPVARFLYGFFSSSPSLTHKHFLVDINDHGVESMRTIFKSLTSLETLNFGRGSVQEKINKIRSLNADIVVDLNGWTGNNILRGFLSRLAPIQVNYLGYFATTGLPTMDYWFGDSHLFPPTNSEWHTETILRLKRCFIAWQPPDPLPEANIDLVESSGRPGVMFGSFNNSRKFSDETLQLWGTILTVVHNSYLVLKANNFDDDSTQELLRRRMIRHGLDIQRVIWLPRAKSSIQHLQQYSHIDIALDCFPNGGCTTTCEALWMGVPVITLSGNSYVSRMSTAVLHGAGLSEFCASSPSDYLQIARSQSERIQWLRTHRNYWRDKVIHSPLGDAADLMFHLENAFAEIYATVT